MEPNQGPRTERTSRKRWWIAAAIGVVAVIALALFAPWRLIIDNRIDEALPAVAATAPIPPASAPAPAPPGADSGSDTSTTSPAVPAEAVPLPAAVERGGAFTSKAHPTAGRARIVDTGSQRFVRIEDLDTDNGPDVIVVLSRTTAGEYGIGDGYLELGALKGNQGNQNYEIPIGTDLSDFQSVTLWCRRFSVPFGSAPLDPLAA